MTQKSIPIESPAVSAHLRGIRAAISTLEAQFKGALQVVILQRGVTTGEVRLDDDCTHLIVAGAEPSSEPDH